MLIVTWIGTNVIDLSFIHIFHDFFSQTIDYVAAHFYGHATSLSAIVNLCAETLNTLSG